MPLSRSWLLVTLPAAVGALVLLVVAVVSLVRTVRASVVARVPLRAEQRVEFARAGELTLSLEGERFGEGARGLGFTLTGARGAVPMAPAAVRTRVSSSSRVRVSLYDLTLPSPGTYTLRVDGADGRAGQAAVFSRPMTVALVSHVLALVGLGFLLVGSLVLTGVVLSATAGEG